MRPLMSIPVVLLLAVAAQGRSVQHGAVEPLDVDVQVAGHSSSQMDAARYNVQVQAGDDVPTVTLPGLGELQGTTSITDLSKRTVFSYLGVPFGEAPVGELRFKAPVPKKPWTPTVWNATVPGKVCYQFSASSSAKRRRRDTWPVTDDQQSEDCLVLDVHTPKVDRNAKLPVLVFVHGGSFQTGYAGQKPPTALLDEADIVLVSPQYRLGALGFLNLQTEEVPGNAGLLDLVLALRWVHDNIEHFGGDPSRVTIAGHSAGAASASVLYLSHLTKGLIHGVMPMSGSALGFWAWDRTPEAGAEQITNLVCIGVPNTPEDRLKCLREAEPQVIVQRFLMYAGLSLLQGHLGMSGSIPSLQKAGSDDTKVLLDLPENILSSPNLVALPYMTGVTKHEGTFPLELAESYYLKPTHLESNSSFLRNDVIHVLLQVIGNDDPAGYVSDTTLQAFFDITSLGDYQAMRDGLIDMMGAFGFKSPARRIVERNSELGQPSYLYAFNHNGIYSQNSPEGIYHGADQPYIFPLPKYPTLAGADLEISKVMRKYITNFVIYQNPTPEESQVANSPTWKKYVRDQEDYLELVWPPTARQWFHNEMTVARRDQFNEGGVKVTSTAPASSKAPASSTAPASSNTSSRSSDQTSRTTDGSGTASTVPSLALALCLAVLAVMCAKA